MPLHNMKKIVPSSALRLGMAVALSVSLFLPLVGQAASLGSLPDFRELVKVAGPAVVNINTEKMEKSAPMQRRGRTLPPDFFRGMPGSPFERFFGPFDPFGDDPFGDGPSGPFPPFGDDSRQAPKRRSSSLGSGFIISSDGYIVTNHHVVKGADVIKVTLGEKSPRGGEKEKTYPAIVIGSDSETDIALIKIEVTENLPFLQFGDSDQLEVGEWAVAIGNPFGLDHSVTAGIISAKGRNINSGAFDSFLQTDASINPGNSGGPLLNMEGKVIGINTAIVAQGQGIGFAIPSDMANRIIADLKTNKKISRGWMGVSIQSINDTTAKALGLKDSKGALLGGVMPGEPADKAGLKAGDVIVDVDGEAIASSDALLQAIASKKPGNKVNIKAIRNGESKSFNVTLAERNLDRAERESKDGEGGHTSASASLGLKLRALTNDDIRRLRVEGVTAGLLVTGVAPDKGADVAGIKPGDVILSAALKPVATLEEFTAIVNGVGKERGALMLQIMRRGQKFFVTVEIPQAKADAKPDTKKEDK